MMRLMILWEKVKFFFIRCPFLVFLFLGIGQYRKALFNGKAIGWDSMDFYFTTLLFYIDSLKNFHFPYYNPFTLGGVPLGHNFYSSTMFNPIDFLFAILGTVLPPLYTYQIKFPLFAVLSGYWIYKFIEQRCPKNQALSYLGGLAYFSAVIFPLAGQSSFFHSFVLFAYLLWPFKMLLQSPGRIYHCLAVIVFSALLMKAYSFFIPFFVLGAFIVLLQERSIKFNKLFFAFLIAGCVYLVFAVPSVIYLQDTIADLNGTFKSPEPRLRSLVPEEILYGVSVKRLFGTIVDAYYLGSEGWTRGFNIAMFFLFVVKFYSRIRFKTFQVVDALLLAGTVFFILIASGDLAVVHENLPVLRSFRWAFSYIQLAQVCYLFFICLRQDSIAEFTRTDRIITGLLLCALTVLLVVDNPYLLTFRLMFPVFLLIIAYTIRPSTLLPLAIIFTFVHLTISARRISFLAGNPKAEHKFTRERNQKVTITENKRVIGEEGGYLFNDRTWLYKKEPSLNGFNPAIHPLFWYIKAKPESSMIAIPLCGGPGLNFSVKRDPKESDNVYLENLSGEILRNIRENKCPDPISTFTFTPDKLSFVPVSQFTFILQNLDYFGPASNVKNEKILSAGMRILETSPGVPTEMRFKKLSMLHHIVYLLISFAVILMSLFSYLRKNKEITDAR